MATEKEKHEQFHKRFPGVQCQQITPDMRFDLQDTTENEREKETKRGWVGRLYEIMARRFSADEMISFITNVEKEAREEVSELVRQKIAEIKKHYADDWEARGLDDVLDDLLALLPNNHCKSI